MKRLTNRSSNGFCATDNHGFMVNNAMAALTARGLVSRPVSASSGWDDAEVEDISLHIPSFGVFVSVRLHPTISVLKYAMQ